MEGEAILSRGKDERVFTYLSLEPQILAGLPEGARILDLGCADGPHISRLHVGGWVVGVDVSLQRLGRALRLAPVAAGRGERLPFRDDSFDMVYVSHVLHHAANHRAVLAEIHRVLAPGGLAFVIETCEDNPMMRLARTLHPAWDSDPVRSRFRFQQLLVDIDTAGLQAEQSEQFNVVYWIWAFAQRRIRPLGRLLERAIRAELALVRKWRRFGAYGYVIARKRAPQDAV